MARRILTELFRDGRSAGDALSRICSEIPAAIDPQPNSTHGEALCEFARGITNDASKKDGPQRYAHAILRKPEAIRERWAEAIAKAEKITKKRSAETIAAKASADAAAATAAARVKLEREDAFQAALDAKLASHFAVGDLVNVKGNPDNPYRLDRKTGMGAPTKDLRAIRASDTGAFKSAIPLAKLVMFTLPPEVPVRGAEAVQEFTLERLKELVAKVNNETAPAA